MNAAPTYQEPHWYTNKMKTRCSACHKVAYPDEATCRLRAAQISVKPQWNGTLQPMYPYRGKCGHWHVTRQKPRERLSS